MKVAPDMLLLITDKQDKYWHLEAKFFCKINCFDCFVCCLKNILQFSERRKNGYISLRVVGATATGINGLFVEKNQFSISSQNILIPVNADL